MKKSYILSLITVGVLTGNYNIVHANDVSNSSNLSSTPQVGTPESIDLQNKIQETQASIDTTNVNIEDQQKLVDSIANSIPNLQKEVDKAQQDLSTAEKNYNDFKMPTPEISSSMVEIDQSLIEESTLKLPSVQAKYNTDKATYDSTLAKVNQLAIDLPNSRVDLVNAQKNYDAALNNFNSSPSYENNRIKELAQIDFAEKEARVSLLESDVVFYNKKLITDTKRFEQSKKELDDLVVAIDFYKKDLLYWQQILKEYPEAKSAIDKALADAQKENQNKKTLLVSAQESLPVEKAKLDNLKLAKSEKVRILQTLLAKRTEMQRLEKLSQKKSEILSKGLQVKEVFDKNGKLIDYIPEEIKKQETSSIESSKKNKQESNLPIKINYIDNSNKKFGNIEKHSSEIPKLNDNNSTIINLYGITSTFILGYVLKKRKN